MKNNTNISNIKALNAVENYLSRKGYEILEHDCNELFDFVAKDEDALVFVSVEVAADGLPVEEQANRSEVEKAMSAYLANACEIEDEFGVNFALRFDVVGMMVFNEERALLRHHINALS